MISISTLVFQYNVTELDRARHWQDVWEARRALVECKMLRRPAEATGRFLTTTLRRFNKAKLEEMQKEKEEDFLKHFDKVFKQSYWSYSKTMVKQPLTVMEDPEIEDIAIRMFHSLLLHAGIVNSSSKPLLIHHNFPTPICVKCKQK